MLYHLIYVSTAVQAMTERQLVDLLRESRTRNEKLRITPATSASGSCCWDKSMLSDQRDA